jgi:hypothetical protein
LPENARILWHPERVADNLLNWYLLLAEERRAYHFIPALRRAQCANMRRDLEDGIPQR